MQLDAEDLVAQFRQDWPMEHEVSTLRALVARQAEEIARLQAVAPPPSGFTPVPARSYAPDETTVFPRD